MGIGPWRRGGGRRRSYRKPVKRTFTRKITPIPHLNLLCQQRQLEKFFLLAEV